MADPSAGHRGAKLDNDTLQQLRDSHRRAIEHVDAAIEFERRVVEANRELADSGEAPELHLQRAREGEERIATLEMERGELERRDPLLPGPSVED